MKKTRYLFLKKIYPDYLILIVYKRELVSFDIDDLIYKTYKDKVFKMNINYLILDELDIIKKIEYKDNKFYYYSKLCLVKKIIDRKLW